MNAADDDARARPRPSAHADERTIHSAWRHVGSACLPIVARIQVYLISPSDFVGRSALVLVLALSVVAGWCWTGTEWAPLAGGFAGISIAAALLANPEVLAPPDLIRRKYLLIGTLVAAGVASFDLLRPATRDEFREIREARARRRARQIGN